MSTTNPGPGADPAGGLTHRQPGSPAADDHDRGGPPAPEVIRRGYEADVYDPKSVFSAPVLVVVFFILAFGTVTILFRFLREPGANPAEHPQAAERNAAPLNDRLGRIGRGHEVNQPRLEPLRVRSGDARAITRPELPTGNPPELHPEDIRPSPENTPALYQTGWVDPNKTIARITIDDAMRAATAPGSKVLPAQKNGTAPTPSTNVPSAANAGRGRGESEAHPPEPKKDATDAKDGKKEGGKH